MADAPERPSPGESVSRAEAPRPGRSPGRGVGPTAAAVTESLRRQIQDGEWTAGARLREAQLCAAFKVGRSIVRRALRNLADDGLVIIEPNCGASVTVTTLQEVFDLYELRAGLYGVAARFACLRATPAQMAEILAKSDALLAGSASGETAEELIRQSEAIFSLMADTASTDARAMIAAVRRKTRWHISYVALALSASGRGPFGHWQTMRAALAARDAAQASEGARNILYFMQAEVSRLMLARGLGLANPPMSPLRRRRSAQAA